MSDTFTKAEELAGSIREYIQLKVRAVKLDVAEKTSAVMANLVAGAIVAVIMLLMVIFAGIALSYVFAGLVGTMVGGFLITAGLFLVLAIITWKMRQRIIRLPIMNSIIQQLFKEEDTTDEED
jgi:hypothetical protein